LVAERRGDEIGHWVLRLAFCRSYVFSSFFFVFPSSSFSFRVPVYLSGLRPMQRADENEKKWSSGGSDIVKEKWQKVVIGKKETGFSPKGNGSEKAGTGS